MSPEAQSESHMQIQFDPLHHTRKHHEQGSKVMGVGLSGMIPVPTWQINGVIYFSLIGTQRK